MRPARNRGECVLERGGIIAGLVIASGVKNALGALSIARKTLS